MHLVRQAWIWVDTGRAELSGEDGVAGDQWIFDLVNMCRDGWLAYNLDPSLLWNGFEAASGAWACLKNTYRRGVVLDPSSQLEGHSLLVHRCRRARVSWSLDRYEDFQEEGPWWETNISLRPSSISIIPLTTLQNHMIPSAKQIAYSTLARAAGDRRACHI